MDYYAILGVEQSADEATIKTAYRKLARQCHPDITGGDPDAEAKFKQIGEAYRTLKDPQERAAYDRGEHSAAPGFAGSDLRRGASPFDMRSSDITSDAGLNAYCQSVANTILYDVDPILKALSTKPDLLNANTIRSLLLAVDNVVGEKVLKFINADPDRANIAREGMNDLLKGGHTISSAFLRCAPNALSRFHVNKFCEEGRTEPLESKCTAVGQALRAKPGIFTESTAWRILQILDNREDRNILSFIYEDKARVAIARTVASQLSEKGAVLSQGLQAICAGRDPRTVPQDNIFGGASSAFGNAASSFGDPFKSSFAPARPAAGFSAGQPGKKF